MSGRNPEHKQHFMFLDGLRGVAAFLVGWLHASEIFSLSFHPAHAYLAVDFFFCLSGFVIAYAYDEKLDGEMGFSDFARKRLIRLYPMILCGVMLGGAGSLFGKHGGLALIPITAACLVLLPAGLMVHQQAYPINNPIWSLFFELAANAGYGVERRTMRVNSVVPAILILFVSGLALVALAYGQHGLEFVGYSSVSSFFAGFVRVTFPFFAGVFIYRYRVFKLGFQAPSLAVAVALIAILTQPSFHGTAVYDVIAVIGLFPVIVILGANATNSSSMSKVWSMLGKLSYPFYIIHQPILRAVNQLSKLMHLPSAANTSLSAIGFLTAAASAYLFMTLYDEPVRRWLTARRGNKEIPAVFAGACSADKG